MQALVGYKTPFARTPKYRVKKKGEAEPGRRSTASGLGVIPFIELVVGAYFAWTVWYALSTENYFTVPFHPCCSLCWLLVHRAPGSTCCRDASRRTGKGKSGSEVHEKPYSVGI